MYDVKWLASSAANLTSDITQLFLDDPTREFTADMDEAMGAYRM